MRSSGGKWSLPDKDLTPVERRGGCEMVSVSLYQHISCSWVPAYCFWAFLRIMWSSGSMVCWPSIFKEGENRTSFNCNARDLFTSPPIVTGDPQRLRSSRLWCTRPILWQTDRQAVLKRSVCLLSTPVPLVCRSCLSRNFQQNGLENSTYWCHNVNKAVVHPSSPLPYLITQSYANFRLIIISGFVIRCNKLTH